MKRAVVTVLVAAIIGVGTWYFIRHSPSCSAWRGKVSTRLQASDSLFLAATLAMIQDEMEPSRPWGCPRDEV
jgi:hypothetical protein